MSKIFNLRPGWKNNTIKDVLQKSGGKCWYCGRELSINSRSWNSYKNKPTSEMYVIDHIIPLIKNGGDEQTNLVPSCWSCNSRKRSYDIETYREVCYRSKYHIPKFTDEQIDFLLSNGFVFPKFPPYIFYFEKAGLSS